MERFAWHAVLCPGKKEEYIKSMKESISHHNSDAKIILVFLSTVR